MVWTRLDKRGNSHTRGWNAVVPPLLRRVGSRSGLRSQRRSGVGRTGLVELSRLPPTHRFAFEFARITNFLMASTPAWKVSTLFQNLEATQQQVLRHQPCLWGHWLYIAALRLDHGTLLVVATQRDPHAAIADYAHGWEMETLFGIFKSRGFSLEDTHLQDTERLSKLLALLNLALGWALRSGEWLHQAQPLPIKSHGRRPPSLFRHGLDHLRSIVLNLDCKFEQFLEAVQFLSCT